MNDQLTEADVKALHAAGRHEEIEQARKDGRLGTLLGVPAEEVDLLDRARHGTGVLTSEDLGQLNRLGYWDLVLEASKNGRTPSPINRAFAKEN